MALSPEETKRRYEQLMGKEALERQEKQRRQRCFYCGGFRPNGHLPLCKYKGTGGTA
jgi:hypothetical protein